MFPEQAYLRKRPSGGGLRRMYAWYLKKPLGFSRRVSVHLEKGLPQGVSAVLPGEALPKKRGPISRYQHPERGPSQDAQGVPQEAFGISRSGGGLLEKPASRDTRAPSSREAHLEKRRGFSRWQHLQRELLRMHGHVSQEARSASREERAAS